MRDGGDRCNQELGKLIVLFFIDDNSVAHSGYFLDEISIHASFHKVASLRIICQMVSDEDELFVGRIEMMSGTNSVPNIALILSFFTKIPGSSGVKALHNHCALAPQ